MLHCINQELKKNIHFPYFLLPIAGIILLCLTSVVESDETRQNITVFSLMLQGKAAAEGHIERSSLFLWRQGIGEWLLLFLPLMLTFEYIALLSEERQNRQIHFQLIRSGNFQYCISKIMGGALSGGIIFPIAYVLFGILMAIFFPHFSGFPQEEQNLYLELYFENNIYMYIFKQLIGIFLSGIASSVLGIGAAIFFRNKYILLCLPFLLNYIYRQTLSKLIINATSAGNSVEWIEAFYPEYIMRISINQYWIASFLMLLLEYIILSVLFYGRVKRGIFYE